MFAFPRFSVPRKAPYLLFPRRTHTFARKASSTIVVLRRQTSRDSAVASLFSHAQQDTHSLRQGALGQARCEEQPATGAQLQQEAGALGRNDGTVSDKARVGSRGDLHRERSAYRSRLAEGNDGHIGVPHGYVV